MEALTRLVSESLARYGFDRPVDYRRLRWSRWFRCESLHSLLFVPSQPGVFGLAEEIATLGANREGHDFSLRACPERPRGNEGESKGAERVALNDAALAAEGARGAKPEAQSLKPEGGSARRMLAVTHFFEDDDMAFVLDRMLSRQNRMRDRLLSGRYFIRYVVIEDAAQRRSIASALNQWIANSAEKASGIGAHFASSLEITESCVVRPSPFPSGF